MENSDLNDLWEMIEKQKPFSGIKDDFRRRAPHYSSDWHWIDFAGFQKVLSSSIYMFFTSLAPAITFAMLLANETNQMIGVSEVLLATAIGGIAFSVFAGQPLVIVGVTGPISILTISMFDLCTSWGIDFLSFYAWSQLWAALMHIIIAVFNLCDLIKYVTRFSCETFGILIAIIFIYDGIHGISKYFTDNDHTDSNNTNNSSNSVDMSSVYLQFIIALSTIYLSLFLLGANNWIFFNATIRNILTDYSITIAVIVSSTIAYMGNNIDVDFETLSAPDTFGTTTPRPWGVDLGASPPWAVFLAFIPGFIITVLFAFDHNISSLMAQAKEYKLQKGFSFHYDFLILGLCLIVTGSLGLPPISGMIPHSFLHTKSLISVTKTLNSEFDAAATATAAAINSEKSVTSSGSDGGVGGSRVADEEEGQYEMTAGVGLRNNSSGALQLTQSPTPPTQSQSLQLSQPAAEQSTESIEEHIYEHIVYEQRISNLVQSLLIGLMCFPPFITYLQYIPRCTLDGLFVILGVTSFDGNMFFSRIVYICCDSTCREKYANEHCNQQNNETSGSGDSGGNGVSSCGIVENVDNIDINVDRNSNGSSSPDASPHSRNSNRNSDSYSSSNSIENSHEKVRGCSDSDVDLVTIYVGNNNSYNNINDNNNNPIIDEAAINSDRNTNNNDKTLNTNSNNRNSTVQLNTITGTGTSYLNLMNFNTVIKFTLLQLAVCLTIFGITFTPVVIVFPVLIGVLVPLRMYVLPKYFESNELEMLDPLSE